MLNINNGGQCLAFRKVLPDEPIGILVQPTYLPQAGPLIGLIGIKLIHVS